MFIHLHVNVGYLCIYFVAVIVFRVRYYEVPLLNNMFSDDLKQKPFMYFALVSISAGGSQRSTHLDTSTKIYSVSTDVFLEGDCDSVCVCVCVCV